MASFAKARDAVLESNRDVDAEFLEAARTLQAVIEEYTDVASCHVELGQVIPGSAPRVDVYVEWDAGGRPSDVFGFARLVFETDTLRIFDSADRLTEEIGLDVDDSDLAERLYLAMETIHDVSAERVFTEARVIPAIYRLLREGCDFPETTIPNLLQGLRPRLGLQENVRMVPQEINLVLAENFEDLYNYHFAWAVRTPLTHRPLPDELGPKDSMEEPTPAEEDPALTPGVRFVDDAPVRDADDDEDIDRSQYFSEGRKNGAYEEHWVTPGIAISRKAGKVFLVHEGEKEEIDPETTDEDISARLASMAYQKEDVETGRIIEGGTFEINRRDTCRVASTLLGSSLHEDSASLAQMSTEELWQLAVANGLKVPGDGVTWERDKLLDVLSGED
jgi:hypothetical protein